MRGERFCFICFFRGELRFVMTYTKTHTRKSLAMIGVAICFLLASPAIAEEKPLQGQAANQTFVYLDPPIKAPDVPYKDESGRDRTFGELEGSVVIAVFWATWCPICAVELPQLDKLQARFADGELHVVAIAENREGVPIVRRYFETRGIDHLKIFHDPGGRLAQYLGVSAVPLGLAIDKEGFIVAVSQRGNDWNSAETLSLIGRLRQSGEGKTEFGSNF